MTEFLTLLVAFIIIFGLTMLSLKLGKYRERASGCCGGGQCATSASEPAETECCGRHEH